MSNVFHKFEQMNDRTNITKIKLVHKSASTNENNKRQDVVEDHDYSHSKGAWSREVKSEIE